MRQVDLDYVGFAMRRLAGVACAQRECVAPIYDVNVFLHPTALFSDSRRRTGHICRKARDTERVRGTCARPRWPPSFLQDGANANQTSPRRKGIAASAAEEGHDGDQEPNVM